MKSMMKKMGKAVSFCVVCLFTISIFVGCGEDKASSDTITLTIWEAEQNLEHVEKLCKDFAIDYKSKYPSAPDIAFEFTPYGEGVTIEKLGLYGPTGEGADVLAFVHDKLGTAIQESLLSENIYTEKYVQTFHSGAISAGSIDGKLYGYPITAESQIIMYNKKTVTAAEVESLETFLTSGKKLMWKINDGYYSFSLFTDAILYGVDGTNVNDVKFNGEETLQNMVSILGLTNYENIIMQDANLAVTLMQDTAGTDKIDAVIATPYLYEQIKAAIGAENVGIAPLPSLNNKALRPYSGFKMYGVNRYSKHPNLSHALSEYLTNHKSQTYRMVKQGLLPSLNTVEMLEQVSKIPAMSVYKTSLDQSIVMPNLTIMGSKYWSNFENTMTEIFRDKPSQDDIVTLLTTLQGLVAQ